MDGLGKGRRARLVRAEFSGAHAVREGARVLSKGGVVAFPTESFYGLGVDAGNEEAIRRLFLLKRRPEDRPLLILIPSREALDSYAMNIPPSAVDLMDAFWPGGLTLVLHAVPHLSPLLTAGTGKIGIRLSGHPLATALARALGGAVTGTSANRSDHPACRSAKEVVEAFGEELDLILDGGETEGRAGSTLLDLTVNPPRILREGIVSSETLKSYLKF